VAPPARRPRRGSTGAIISRVGVVRTGVISVARRSRSRPPMRSTSICTVDTVVLTTEEPRTCSRAAGRQPFWPTREIFSTFRPRGKYKIGILTNKRHSPRQLLLRNWPDDITSSSLLIALAQCDQKF